jgi:membrane fusion protein, multidrug efflux system
MMPAMVPSAPRRRASWRAAILLCLTACLAPLAGCGQEEQAAPQPIRPVRVVTVAPRAGGDAVTLTGEVLASSEVSLAFRVGGRMIERAVGVGDRVEAGQLVARLEAETARNAMLAARAAHVAAVGTLNNARGEYGRARELLRTGFGTRQAYDRALKSLQVAEANVEAAEAQFDIAREQLTYTDLVSEAAGSVLATGAEPGEVVAAGRMILRIATAGGLEAAFDVPERIMRLAPPNPRITVALLSDPQVSTTGRVVEVAPQANPVTRTFRVKVALDDPPEAMRLGSTVTGSMPIETAEGVVIPASALTSADGRPAVWVLDPQASTVSLRTIGVLRHDLAQVAVGQGLEADEIVVTAGVQALRPGQKVRLLGAVP